MTVGNDDTTVANDDTNTGVNGVSYSNDHRNLIVDNNYSPKSLRADDFDPNVININANALSKSLNIIGNDNDNSILAGRRGGSINGADGNDTLVGNIGNDVFVYDSGDDLILNYTTLKDKLKFNVDIDSYAINGGDVVFVTDEGILTVKDALDKKIKVIDSNGKSSNHIYDMPLPEGATYNSSHSIVKFGKNFDEDLDASDYNEKIRVLNASKVNNPVELIGNDNNNIIKLGPGGGTLDGADGNDKLYGNAGNDLFVYSGGNDIIYKYTPSQDTIQIDFGDVESVQVNDSTVVLNFDDGSLSIKNAKDKTLTIIDIDGELNDYVFTDSTDDFSSGLVTRQANQAPVDALSDVIFNPDAEVEAGLTVNSAGNAVTVDNDYSQNALDINSITDYGASIVTINALDRSDDINITANSKANVISLGSSDGIIDGADGNDRIYLSDGNDTVLYVANQGNDTIFNFDPDRHLVSLSGVASVSKYNAFNLGNGNIVLDLGDNSVAFADSSDTINVAYNDQTITVDLADVIFSSNRQAVTIGADATDSDFDASNYSRLQSIDATRYESSAHLVGNDNNNVISIGSYGGIIDGGTGGNNKLYGNEGEDTFVFTTGLNKRDTVFNYNEDDRDIISINGVDTLDVSNFYPSSGNVLYVNLGNDTLTLINYNGALTFDYGGSETFEYSSKGISFSNNLQSVTLNADYEGESFNASGFSQLKVINASKVENSVELIGNSLNNDIYIGTSGGTLDGGAGNDKLYGGGDRDLFVHTVGAGSDTFYNFNGDDDEVQLFDRTQEISVSSFINFGDGFVLLDLGNDTVTFSNSSGEIRVNYGTESNLLDFTFNPGAVIFSSNRQNVTVTDDYDDDDDSFDANIYPNVRNINASRKTDELNIIGNDYDNAVTAGSGGGSLIGGNGRDTLTGGEGNDIFVYTVGSGNDTIVNYTEDDIIQIYGFNGELNVNSFIPSSNGVALIDLGNDTLTVVNAQGSINVQYGQTALSNETVFSSQGITVASDRRGVSVDDQFDQEELIADNYGDAVVTLNTSRRSEEIAVVGNALDNVISLGSGGGKVDGGAGADQLYGGSGRDIFAYTLGSAGNDTIYKFDSTNDAFADVIMLSGVDELSSSVFKLSGNNTVLVSLGSDTISVVKSNGIISIVDESENELINFNANGANIYGDRLLQIDGSFNDTLVDARNYGDELETITAVTYTGKPDGQGVSIVGNDLNNVIRAGVYNFTLDGGTGNDSLYGDSQMRSADSFVVTVGSGTKYIYNYSTTLDGAEDVIALVGDTGDIDDSNFTERGTETTLNVNGTDIVFVNPKGDIKVVDEDGNERHTYGLPDGLDYAANKKYISIDDDYSDGTFDASNYNDGIETISARDRTTELEIIGNAADNLIRAGSGGGTVDGAAGNDKLSGNTGADVFRYTPGQGNDTIYDYDSTNEDNPDVIMISGVDTLSQNAIRQLSGGNVEISLKGGTLTLVEPTGAITLVNDYGDELLTFKTAGNTLSSDSRILYVGPNYEDTIVSASNYSSLVATIMATEHPYPLVIEGNSNANVIKAGDGGSTIDGGGYNDHLYGGAGADLFRYKVGEGNDYIYNFNSTLEDSIDAIQILGYSGGITKANFRDTANGNTVIQIGTNTLTLINPIGAVSVFGADMEEEEPFVYGKSLQSGVSYNYNKTKLTIGQYADLEDEEARTFIVDDYSNNLRHIDGSRFEDEPLIMLGNDKANEFQAGSGGSSMNGGGGIDKLYGGAGADTYVYEIGQGNDYIYYYDATNDDAMDVVQILGDTSGITKSSFRDSGKNTVLTLGTSQLTFVNARGRIILVDEEGDEIIGYDSTLESGVSYSDNKMTLTINRDANLEENTFDMDTLVNNLRNIDGSSYEGDLYLLGNYRPNELRAGSGGATLDGRDGSDKLYGGAGEDVFVISVGSGNDIIYNYNGDQGDVIQLFGSNGLTKSNFFDSNNSTFLNIGNQKVMLENPVGAITVIDGNGDELIVYGSSLPSGVYYENNRSRLVIGANAELDDEDLEFDVDRYANNLRDIDASAYSENPVTLVGNNYANVLKAGTAGSQLDGGTGNDQLYGGAGADTFVVTNGEGNEIIYNYDGSQEDIVQVLGVTELTRANFRDSGSNVVLSLPTSNVTFVNARGPIILVDETGNTIDATYDETLPVGMTYNSTRTKLTVGDIEELEDPLLDMATLANNIKDIDATRYTHEIWLKGNARTNELRAGTNGSSLDGGTGIDKLYGGAGADTYVVSVGGGNDLIYNYNGSQGDIIQVFGVDTISPEQFTDSGSNVILNLGTERIAINNPRGTIRVVTGDGNDEITYGGDLPYGVSYSADKTTMVISRNAELDDDVFDMATLANSLKNIDGSAYEGNLVLIGNAKANELRAGSGGSSLDGGAGNDKLYGGAGADIFVVSVGSGNDYIYNFNGTDGDAIQLIGTDTINDDDYRESGNNVLVAIGNNRLTLAQVQGPVRFLDEDGNEIRTFNPTMPDGVYYNNNKTKLTISANADLSESNEFDAETLSSNLRDIDASAYEGEIILKGNSRANDLRAGTNGSSLDGSTGNDKLYGGAGADTFAYTLGEGNDYIYNYSGGEEDVIQIYGLTYLDETAFRDSGDNVIITAGSNRLTLSKPQGQIVVLDENGSTLATYNDTLPVGVSYSSNKQKLIIGANAELEDPAIRIEDYVETLRDIDASAYGDVIALTGDPKANELYAGSGGSTLDGGLGNDKLYGGAGADVFEYTIGDGNDYIYNYNHSEEEAADVLRVIGVSGIDQADFRDSGRNTVLTIGDNRITFVNPKGQIVVQDDGGEVLATYGTTLPSGVYYNSSKSKLTIGRSAELEENEFDMATLSSNIRNIDGSGYTGDLVLIGNAKANELRAGSGGSTLNGGLGADKIYGGSGADVFVYANGDGNDRIFNYSGGDGDVLQVEDVGLIEKTDFKDSGNNVILTIGTDRVTFVSPQGQISVVGSDGEVLATYGEAIPNGVVYNSNHTQLTILESAELEEDRIDMSDYNNSLRDVDATRYEGALEIVGNGLSNELKASAGGSTLNGGEGADKLYGGAGTDEFVYNAGEGNDRIYNYSYTDEDMIVISGIDEIDKSNFRESGKNTVITVGDNKLTVINAPSALRVSVEGAEEEFVYGKELPEGVSYNSSKTKLTISANAELDENEFRVEEYSNNLKDINGSKYDGELILIGDDKANELRAGSGGGTLSGGGSNDKLYAGSGADVIVYSSGNDIVYGFNAESDSVLIEEGEMQASRISGNDIVYQIGTGTLTLKNVASYGLTSINISSAEEEFELGSDEYWFDQSTESDPLNDVMTTEIGSADMPTDFDNAFKNMSTELTMNENNKGARRINYDARHR